MGQSGTEGMTGRATILADPWIDCGKL